MNIEHRDLKVGTRLLWKERDQHCDLEITATGYKIIAARTHGHDSIGVEVKYKDGYNKDFIVVPPKEKLFDLLYEKMML